MVSILSAPVGYQGHQWCSSYNRKTCREDFLGGGTEADPKWPLNQHSGYTSGMPSRSDSSACSFSAESRKAFYEAHPSIALFMLVIVFAAPFAGLYVAGLLGVVVGVLVSAAAYVLTPCLWK